MCQPMLSPKLCVGSLGECWAAADSAHNLTIWMVKHRCTGLCNCLAQFSSVKMILVFKSIHCLLNALLRKTDTKRCLFLLIEFGKNLK